MAFNLPPPWNAGYALPDNVKDEGLERRGFVTKWMTRGTYDDPKVGTGGYAVPKYVTSSGYGQGERVTKWMPVATGQPNVPHYLDRRPKLVKQQSLPNGNKATFALSGDDMPAPFANFGARAASEVLRRVATAPPNQRKAILKKILDAIDPSLWSRCATITERYIQQGITPSVALQNGLARAMSTGMAAEVIQAGKSRRAPQANSLLGLGCYGAKQALGAVTVVSNQILNALTAPGMTVSYSSSTPQQNTGGTCPAGQTGYNWAPAANGVPAHWERVRAGQVAQYCGNIAPSGPPGGVTVKDTHDAIQVGPIFLPINETRGSQVLFKTPASLTPEIAAWVKTTWTGKQPLKNNPNWATDPAWKSAANPWNSPKTAEWLRAVGFVDGDFVKGAAVIGFSQPDTISYKFVHPVTGAEWLMRVGLSNTSLGGQTLDASKPVELRIWANPPQDRSLLSKALSIVAKVAKPVAEYGGGIVAGALDIVSDLACATIGDPRFATASSAASVAAGAGASAGAAGAAIAQGLCAGDPAPAPVIASGGSSVLPYVIAGGAVIAAVLLSTSKKKTP